MDLGVWTKHLRVMHYRLYGISVTRGANSPPKVSCLQRINTYRRHISKISRPHNPALVPIPQLQVPLRDEKYIMRVVVVVKPRGIREHCAALENCHQAICLLGRCEDAKDAFAAGDGDAFSLQLWDCVWDPRLGWLVAPGQRHGRIALDVKMRNDCSSAVLYIYGQRRRLELAAMWGPEVGEAVSEFP